MKSFVAALMLFTGFQAHAEINSIETYNQLLSGSDCIDKLETALHTITHPSKWLWLNPALGFGSRVTAYTVRENVNHNLDLYLHVVNMIQNNLDKGISNDRIYSLIDQSLAKQNDSILGRPIASCIRTQLNFSGTKRQQKVSTKLALSKIKKIRKAVN